MIQEALDGPAAYEVVAEDLFRVVGRDAAVPDVVGIDHHHRSAAALAHATRLIDANAGFTAGLAYQLFQARMNGHGIALHGAHLPARADEYMFFIGTHTS